MFTRFSVAALAIALASQVHANSILFTTPVGSSVVDGPVSASALFNTLNGSVEITLNNLLVNPTSAGQLLSDLEFRFDPQVVGTPVLTGSSASEVTISGGTGTLGSSVSTGWGFGSYNSGYILCIICPAGITTDYQTAPPSHLIIGPGPYTNANGSILSHNPSLLDTATFTITNPFITPGTNITNVVFSFGTTFGSNVNATDPVPEPGAWLMAGLGLGCLAAARAYRRRQARAGQSVPGAA